ncbi:HU family DNA-binding protein [bacterium]|nr:HU family DNA-binding protein [bacterium]
MTRRELIAAVNQRCKFSNADRVEYIIRLVEEVMTDALVRGQTIKLNSFLKLGTKQSKPRKITLQNKQYESKSKTVAFAKVSPTIQRKIQEYQEQQADMDWLDEFSELPYDMQYDLVKLAKEQANE